MEKGLVFDIRRYSVHDGPGIRTTIFFKGCPLRCRWCHNPEGLTAEPAVISRTRMLDGKLFQYDKPTSEWYTPEAVFEVIEKDRIFYEESGGGVTFSGGEPLMQPGFLLDLIELCRKNGIHTTLDTSGYAPENIFKTVTDITDLVLFDLKSTDNEKHILFTGADNKLIISNLKSLNGEKPKLIIRIPVIPGFNTETVQIEAMRDQIANLDIQVSRVDLLPFHSLGHQKYRSLGIKYRMDPLMVADNEILENMTHIFMQGGFKVKKGG
ncbi:MAG: glycyl-radical enzyme activating protein [Bacteroidales bacterium]